LGKKDLIKKIPFKKFSLKIPSPKKVAADDCFAAWDIAFYYIDEFDDDLWVWWLGKGGRGAVKPGDERTYYQGRARLRLGWFCKQFNF
jgi:hypothetical protein